MNQWKIQFITSDVIYSGKWRVFLSNYYILTDYVDIRFKYSMPLISSIWGTREKGHAVEHARILGSLLIFEFQSNHIWM